MTRFDPKNLSVVLGLGLLLVGLATPGHAEAPRWQLHTVLGPIAVADANASVFATPLAVDGADGNTLYTVNVEPGLLAVPTHGFGLKTVVRRGQRDDSGHWRWSRHLIDGRTANDPYHTAASIGLDRAGYVHVVYNMHNLPWQYQVSRQPRSIAGFTFRGQAVTPMEQWGSEHRRVEFPALGTAAIPGTQITYPAFFNDQDGALYVTYRYAARPARNFFDRQYSGGLARYDETTQTWQAIGGDLALTGDDAKLPAGHESAVTHPLISEPGWWVYQMRLAFDADNGMHVAWFWREHSSGVNQDHASYAYSPADEQAFYRADGHKLTLPIGLAEAGRVGGAELARRVPDGFYSPARISVAPAGVPILNLQSVDGTRYRLRLFHKHWSAPEPTPAQAWQLHYDGQGHEWAFASGLTVLRRPVDRQGTPTGTWQTVFKARSTGSGRLCHPRAVRAINGDDDGNHPRRPVYYIHANVISPTGHCNDNQVTIVRLAAG